MSHINNQTQDLNSIELVQDLDHEAAATVSGGALYLSDYYYGKGEKREYTGDSYSLGSFNSKASWYENTGDKDWYIYSNENYQGEAYVLKAHTKGNFYGYKNNYWKSAKPRDEYYYQSQSGYGY
ncbi:hypothetical protein [Nostoc sp. ChiQUE01b]|uniref:hypothetical protein n=1 Tax=Nostoc sp. ChiQUE01b TaxID=3075376 RepID=UPI002AD5888C|nr:hypothetical protein [Nostoc sp. ChiQUE01b]MDZ8258228.1 hypothetical protein [Nostoc sp. ChiQUE01b]MDZ8258229.1 hypothetical protein [Nostoc sp. ChiQUE01b]